MPLGKAIPALPSGVGSIPALMNFTRKYGTERTGDLTKDGTTLWLQMKTKDRTTWNKRLLTEKRKYCTDKMTFVGAALLEWFIDLHQGITAEQCPPRPHHEEHR